MTGDLRRTWLWQNRKWQCARPLLLRFGLQVSMLRHKPCWHAATINHFAERFRGFPAEVPPSLSRLSAQKEANARAMASTRGHGEMCVVGTHALLGEKSVKFKNLGLLDFIGRRATHFGVSSQRAGLEGRMRTDITC